MHFIDRSGAGKKLSLKFTIQKYQDFLVLALPRGGVPPAAEIAKKLKAPLMVIIARKISSPHHPEYGLGAISEENTLILDESRMAAADVTYKDLKFSIKRETNELKRRVKLYRNNQKLKIKNKNIILVDDGLATGVTARAAVEAAKKLGAKIIVFTAPVCARQSATELKKYVDSMVCLIKPQHLKAIGSYYKNFEQVSDKEVITLLTGK